MKSLLLKTVSTLSAFAFLMALVAPASAGDREPNNVIIEVEVTPKDPISTT